MRAATVLTDRPGGQAECQCPAPGYHAAWDLEPCTGRSHDPACPLWEPTGVERGARPGCPPDLWLG